MYRAKEQRHVAEEEGPLALIEALAAQDQRRRAEAPIFNLDETHKLIDLCAHGHASQEACDVCRGSWGGIEGGQQQSHEDVRGC